VMHTLSAVGNVACPAGKPGAGSRKRSLMGSGKIYLITAHLGDLTVDELVVPALV
jgi:hypothetical protein